MRPSASVVAIVAVTSISCGCGKLGPSKTATACEPLSRVAKNVSSLRKSNTPFHISVSAHFADGGQTQEQIDVLASETWMSRGSDSRQGSWNALLVQAGTEYSASGENEFPAQLPINWELLGPSTSFPDVPGELIAKECANGRLAGEPSDFVFDPPLPVTGLTSIQISVAKGFSPTVTKRWWSDLKKCTGVAKERCLPVVG